MKRGARGNIKRQMRRMHQEAKRTTGRLHTHEHQAGKLSEHQRLTVQEVSLSLNRLAAASVTCSTCSHASLHGCSVSTHPFGLDLLPANPTSTVVPGQGVYTAQGPCLEFLCLAPCLLAYLPHLT